MPALPIVVLEPSCASVFRDELRNLFPDHPRAARLRSQTFLLSEFLERHAPGYEPPRLSRKVLLHGHCHQKALMKMTHEESLLRKMGADLQSLDSGCCGMAGPFGFEREKYAISQAVGERVLLPAVRQASAGDADHLRWIQLPRADPPVHRTPRHPPGRSHPTRRQFLLASFSLTAEFDETDGKKSRGT